MLLVEDDNGLRTMEADELGEFVDQIRDSVSTLNEIKIALGGDFQLKIISGGKIGAKLTLGTYC